MKVDVVFTATTTIACMIEQHERRFLSIKKIIINSIQNKIKGDSDSEREYSECKDRRHLSCLKKNDV